MTPPTPANPHGPTPTGDARSAGPAMGTDAHGALPPHATRCEHRIDFGLSEIDSASAGDRSGSTTLPAAQTHEHAVRFRGVTKTFGTGPNAVHALRGIDLDVAPGRLVMLVGPSGCGKTTLVSIISGVLDADTGAAEVFGVDWLTLSQDERAKRRRDMVGFVFQQFNLIPTLSIAENVSVPLLIRGMQEKEALDRSREALARVGLGDRTRALPTELSGGQQQRVAIARAVVAMPRLIVCDEPTASLDAKRGQDVLEIIHEASRSTDQQGRARCVIVVTHDSRIFHYADRIIEMDDGRLLNRVSRHIMDEAQVVPHYDEDPDEQEAGATAPAPTQRTTPPAPGRSPGSESPPASGPKSGRGS